MLRADPLVRAFRELVARTPDAVLIAGARRRSTVADVARLSECIANKLAAAELCEGSVVGFRIANGPAFLAGMVACLDRGVVPLLLDVGMPAAEIDRAMAACHAGGLASCEDSWPDDSGAIDVERRGAGSQAPRGACVIKLSSGSTGTPRGVVTPISCLLADDDALTATMGFTSTDRLVAMVPFSHSYGLSSLVLPALVRGTLLVLADRGSGFDALERAKETEATVLPTVPAYVSALLRTRDAPDLPRSLRRILTAGAPLLPETARRFRRRFDRPIHVFYGASECGGIAYDREGSAAENGTVGEPIDGVRIDLTDGRVCVSSAAVAQGYYPEEDPRLAGGRFITDDLARWSDGRLTLTGRVGRFINVKGNKVNPVEVERVISLLEGVEDVQVTRVTRDVAGDEQVRAIVCCRPGRLTVADIQTWCRQRLSDYKVPRSIVLVDRIAVDARGKSRLTT